MFYVLLSVYGILQFFHTCSQILFGNVKHLNDTGQRYFLWEVYSNDNRYFNDTVKRGVTYYSNGDEFIYLYLHPTCTLRPPTAT